MTHLKKYWIWYLLGAVGIIALVSYNWDSITSWFSSASAKPDTMGSTPAGKKRSICRCANGRTHPSLPAGGACDDACKGIPQ